MDQATRISSDGRVLDALIKRVECLEREIADLKLAFDIELASNLEHAEATYQYIGDIHDYLMPLVRKVFPGYTATQRQIDRVIRRGDGKKSC
jgi:hypothetical protein